MSFPKNYVFKNQGKDKNVISQNQNEPESEISDPKALSVLPDLVMSWLIQPESDQKYYQKCY